ncbi:MAG: DUF202 domain-containing protein [Actinomycetota bacterium]
MPHPGEIYDPGLQQERTVLAWDRTGLALMVASGLLVRSLGQPIVRPITLIPAATFLVGMVILLIDRPRYLARWRGLQAGHGMAAPGPVIAVTAGTLVLGVTALLVALGF